MLKLNEVNGGVRLEVKVQPRSSRNQLVGVHEGALKVKLTAAPVDGEANQALIKFFSSLFKVPKRDIILLKGDSGRSKLLEIKGVKKEEIQEIIRSSV